LFSLRPLFNDIAAVPLMLFSMPQTRSRRFVSPRHYAIYALIFVAALMPRHAADAGTPPTACRIFISIFVTARLPP